jgi:hypothetical protein
VRPNGHSEKLASFTHWIANGSPMIVIARIKAQNNQPNAMTAPHNTSHSTLPMVLTIDPLRQTYLARNNP